MRPLGIFAWFGYDLPVQQSLKKIKAAGFDGVMLWWGEFEGDIPLAQQPKLARSLGLRVENAHAPFDGCNSLWEPGMQGDLYADSLVRCAQGCAEAGVRVLVAHLSDGPAPPPWHPRGVERLRQAVEAARRLGVVLALENLRHPDYLRRTLDALPDAALCYDSGHAQVEFPPVEHLPDGNRLPARYAGRVEAVHLHDNDGKADRHLLPFDGVIDWQGVAGRLRAAEYAGPLTLEVQAGEAYEGRMDADAFLARAYAAAARLRGLLDGEGPGRLGLG